MPEKTIDLTVRSITRIEREKKDLDTEREILVARDAEGMHSMQIQGPRGSFEGYKAEMPITVKFARSQKTIAEATTASRKSEPDPDGEEKPKRTPVKPIKKK